MPKVNDSGDASRRAVLFGSVGLVGAGLANAQGKRENLTAGAVIERIKEKIGVPSRDTTVDNIIEGSTDTPVRGIAVTMMATLDVVQRAAAAGKNMVITHEPTYYSHRDSLEGLAGDETYEHKADFLRRNGMVVFHLHDHWHDRRPDGIAMGMARELGWQKNMDPQKWDSLEKTLPLLRYKKYYKDARFGYCRGTEPVRYVNRVMMFYDILCMKNRMTQNKNILSEAKPR